MAEESDFKVEAYPQQPIYGMSVGFYGGGIKVTHVPTGISAVSTQERSQHRNKRIAMEEVRRQLEHPVYAQWEADQKLDPDSAEAYYAAEAWDAALNEVQKKLRSIGAESSFAQLFVLMVKEIERLKTS